MNNITYSIIDPKHSDSDSDSDSNIIQNSNNSNHSSNNWDEILLTEKSPNNEINKDIGLNNSLSFCNEICAREMDLDLNYSVKYLSAILDYYEIKKNKLNKKDMISKIVEFEIKSENNYIVENRRRLFENFIELKNDTFFSKFIVSNFT